MPEAAGPELVWPGKDSPAPLPAPAQLALQELAGDGAGRLICGDNLAVMRSLVGELAGAFDLIVIDPPFASGKDRPAKVTVGRGRGVASRVTAPGYKDRWPGGLSGWLSAMRQRLPLLRELLAEHGSLYVHVDTRAAPGLRFLLDECFGAGCFVNELIWSYRTGGMPERLGFGRKHDTILFYAKNPRQALWQPQKEKSYLRHRYGFTNVELHEDEGGTYSLVNARDVLEVPALRGNQPQRVDYPTQKPIALLERIIRASSREGGLIGDLFCGSGTSLVAAQGLGRRWLGCDRSARAVHVSAKRLSEADAGFSRWLQEGHELPDPPTPRLLLEPGAEGRLRLDGLDFAGIKQLKAKERGFIERWDDAVDLWAVDWDRAPGEPFRADWCAARSRRQRELSLLSEPAPESAGQSWVRVVDVLGGEAIIPFGAGTVR